MALKCFVYTKFVEHAVFVFRMLSIIVFNVGCLPVYFSYQFYRRDNFIGKAGSSSNFFIIFDKPLLLVLSRFFLYKRSYLMNGLKTNSSVTLKS